MKTISEIQTDFIKNLNMLIKEKSFKNTSDFSLAINVPRRTITSWLSRERMPQIDYLYLLADYFGCTVDYLIGREL